MRKNLLNRIISLFTVFVICFSLFTVPASASEPVSFYDFVQSYINLSYAVDNVKDFWNSVFSSSDDPDTAYSDYVTDLQTELGTSVIANGALRIFFPAFNASVLTLTQSGIHFEASCNAYSYPNIEFLSLQAPFDCTYQVGWMFSLSNCTVSTAYEDLSCGSVASGSVIKVRPSNSTIVFHGIVDGSLMTVSGSVYADFTPLAGTLSDNTGVDVSSDTRAGSLAGDLYYLGDDGQQIVAENVTIVDESADTYYNPTTGDITDITNWNYDYSDRSYNVTTTSGDTYTITYGDEYITVNEGDTTYTYYYTIPSDDSGTTTDDSTDWDWWKTEWTDFRTWLSGLSFVGGGDSSELTDSPDSSGSSSSSSSGDTSAFYSIDDATGDITINQDYDYSGDEDGLDFGGVVKATGKGIWWLAKSVIGIFAGAITNVGSAVSGLAKIGKASNTTGAYGFFFQ